MNTTQNPSQKRTRSAPRPQLPPLPKITGEIILQVFTHRSLQRSHGGTLDDNSDNRRLAVLGKTVLEVVVTHLLFKRKPPLATADMRVRLPPGLVSARFTPQPSEPKGEYPVR